LVRLLRQQAAAGVLVHLLAQRLAAQVGAADQAVAVQAEQQGKVLREAVAQTQQEAEAVAQAQLVAQEAAQQAETAEQVQHHQLQVLALLMLVAEGVEQTPADRVEAADRAEAEQDQQGQVLRVRSTLVGAVAAAETIPTAAQVVRALLFFLYLLQNTRALQPDRQQLPLMVAIPY
jgi:hypothetical protein